MSRRQKKNLVHTLSQIFRQIFRRRNIIVVCDQSIDSYPINWKAQTLLIGGVVAAICWISYSTGSYMASQSVLEQKDRQILSTAMKTRQIGEEYSLLRRDLQKLQENQGELSDYARFVLKQHSVDKEFALPELMEMQDTDGKAVSGAAHERLLSRVTFLEDRIEKLQQENIQFVLAVKERTRGKIKELNEVIRLAGFNPDRMQRLARRMLPKEELISSGDFQNQGGPYIPEKPGRVGGGLDTDLDRLMLLDSIVRRFPLGMPMKGAKITSGYGRRIDPFHRRWAMHGGMDFVSGEGAPIYATSDGVVKSAGWGGSYGNRIQINHGVGISTLYGHLSKVLVRPGQRVTEGQMIGRQGSTGRSTGKHLHYEVRFNDRPLNPHNFLKAGYYVQKKEARAARNGS